MIPELGHFALILALLLSVVLGTLPIVGARAEHPGVDRARAAGRAGHVRCSSPWPWAASSIRSSTSDFSVLNVATNSNSQLPVQYRIAATWGSHEGSMLLWVFMLAFWTLAVSLKSRHLPDEMVARVLGVMGLVSFGFLLFMLLTSNPFDRLFPVPADGRDLNPLLQDPGHGDAPADAVHGLRRLLGRVRVRHRRAAGRAPGRHLGALVAAVDHARLELPHHRHHDRQLVGLLRRWAGAAGGSGIRSRTPRSCPGWSAPR